MPKKPELGMKRILVTGGCGFIGSALVRSIVSGRDASVLNLDKLTYAATPQAVPAIGQPPNYIFRRLDVCASSQVASEIMAFQPDLIFHLAAESHVDRSIDSPAAFVQTNVVGSYSLLETARSYWESLDEAKRGGFRFIHVSTDEVYGSLDRDDAPFSELSPYRPNSPYAASKASSDHLARAWHRTFGLPVIVTNCCNNFGPFQFPEKLIPTIVLAALQGARLPVYGTGANVREWLFVEDHVRALLAIGQRGSPGETYLVGSGDELSNLDLVRRICGIMDELDLPHKPHERLIEFVQDRPGHDLRYALDSSKVRREIGWLPQESFSSALKKTVLWYIENREWWEAVQRDRYDGRRLGLGARVSRSGE